MKNKPEAPSPSPATASRTKRIVTWLFNPRAWSDWDRSKSIAYYFLEMIERFFVIRKPKPKTASFDKAVAKYDLDEKTLETKSLGLLRLSYALLGMALFLFAYCIYQLLFGSLNGALIAFVEIAIALVLAFRYHFWHFQIKQRKLGCGVKEWFKYSFTGGKNQ